MWRNLRNCILAKNPQKRAGSLQVTGAEVFQTPHVYVQKTVFLLVILLGLASQIKIFGEVLQSPKRAKYLAVSIQCGLYAVMSKEKYEDYITCGSSTCLHIFTFSAFVVWKPRAAIQRRRPILAWTVILSVYGTDTIAIDLSLSALISWFMKLIVVFLNNSDLHSIDFYIFIN